MYWLTVWKYQIDDDYSKVSIIYVTFMNHAEKVDLFLREEYFLCHSTLWRFVKYLFYFVADYNALPYVKLNQ